MLIHGAAAGDDDARAEFFGRYEPAARRYLGARWNGTPYLPQLEDAVQQVFVECFQDGGALQRVDEDRRFAPFLHGVVKRVAQKFETDKARQLNRQAPDTFHPEAVPVDETSASRAFDRAYAMDVMRRAHEALRNSAREKGDRHERRVELLRLRFVDGMPIRDIAAKWGEEAKRVSWEYEKARQEFKDELRDVLGLHEQCPEHRLGDEIQRILDLLRW